MKTTVIKYSKHKPPEEFSENKFKQSIESTCLSLKIPLGLAEDTSSVVAAKLNQWLTNKSEVTSQDIRLKASEILNDFNPELAHFYQNYRQTL